MNTDSKHSDIIAEVTNLEVRVPSVGNIVDHVSFAVQRGEILGLVGQSGSGKTTIGMSMLGYTRHGAIISGGSITVDGKDVRALTSSALKTLRGRSVAYVPQDPRASLSGSLTIEQHIGEMLESSGIAFSKRERLERIQGALTEVGLPSTRQFLKRYPHQLSGGQLQRVGIAMAIVMRPPFIVLDEPTTGLDVTTQAIVLALVRRLASEHGISMLYVTHDLAVVAEIADRVVVLNHGKIVEQGATLEVFEAPREEYTQRLLAAAPDVNRPAPARAIERHAEDEHTPTSVPVLEVRHLAAAYRHVEVLQDVNLSVQAGECLAVVGESGSGKSTLSRAIIGLHPSYTGDIRLDGEALPRKASRRPKQAISSMQYIFQSPYTALNPRQTIGGSIEYAYSRTHPGASSKDRSAAVNEALDRVGLQPEMATLLPNRLSGGERQRVAIARALVTEAKLLLCDEITSALDVLVQASIIELLEELQESGLSMLFVTHNLALVRSFADRVMVLDQGRVVETAATEDLFENPQHTTTQALLTDSPSIERSLAERSSGHAVPTTTGASQ